MHPPKLTVTETCKRCGYMSSNDLCVSGRHGSSVLAAERDHSSAVHS